jgi:hypothetical protein
VTQANKTKTKFEKQPKFIKFSIKKQFNEKLPRLFVHANTAGISPVASNTVAAENTKNCP